MTLDWWPVDRFRGMFRFMTGPSLWRLARRRHAPIDQFVICTPPNGWGTAVVGVNEGTAGRVLMPSATALLFFCFFVWCADEPLCLVSEKHPQPLRCTWTMAELLVNSRSSVISNVFFGTVLESNVTLQWICFEGIRCFHECIKEKSWLFKFPPAKGTKFSPYELISNILPIQLFYTALVR